MTSIIKMTSKMKTTSKMNIVSRMKMTSNKQTTSKIAYPQFFTPPPLKKLPDVKPEMLSGVKTGNGIPHDKYDMRDIAHARTNRKDNIFMQRRQVQSFTYILEKVQRDLYIDKAHRSSSNEGQPPRKVVFHRRSSSTKGRLPPKVVFVALIFVKKNLPNLSLLPC